jgi:hypothetical protein
MHIYFNYGVLLVCPACANLNAQITEDQIFCVYCGWTRKRRYPVPYKSPNWASIELHPLQIQAQKMSKLITEVKQGKTLYGP